MSAIIGLINWRFAPFLLTVFLDRVCWKSFSWGQGVGLWGVGFYRFWGGQLPNFQGKSPGIFPPITPGSGNFWLTKSLKVLPNKVFRFIQPTLDKIIRHPYWYKFSLFWLLKTNYLFPLLHECLLHECLSWYVAYAQRICAKRLGMK